MALITRAFLDRWYGSNQSIANGSELATIYGVGGHHITTPASGKRPVLYDDVINGQKVMQIDGVEDFFQTPDFGLLEAYTYFLVVAVTNPLIGGSLIDGLDFSHRAQIYNPGDNRLQFYNGQSAGYTDMMPQSNAYPFARIGVRRKSNGEITFWKNGIKYFQGILGGQGINGLTLGTRADATQSFVAAQFADIALYSDALTDAEYAQNDSFFCQTYMPSKFNVVVEGDSEDFGFNPTPGATNPIAGNVSDRLKTYFGADATVYNVATTGIPIANDYPHGTPTMTERAAYLVDSLADALKPTYLIVGGGFNDMNDQYHPATAAQIISRMTTYHAARSDNYFVKIQQTLPYANYDSGNPPNYLANRMIVNNQLLAGALGASVRAANYTTNLHIGTNSDTTNALYFYDGLHYTSLGNGEKIPILVALIRAAIAKFTAPESVMKNESFQIVDQSSNTPTSYLINWGDGTFDTNINAAHSYQTVGTKTISVTATNAFGSSTVSHQITVTPSFLGQHFEELLLAKIFNVTNVNLKMPLLEANFGAGYGAGVLTAPESGLRYWSISSELVPDVDQYSVSFSIGSNSYTATRFGYFWDFYRRHVAMGNKPFYFTDPRTGRIFLASFAEKEISFEAITGKLYRGGVMIRQRRVKLDGLTFRDDDGSCEQS